MRSDGVIVVDDDPIMRAVAAQALGALGYDCREAEDGAVAMTLLEAAPAALAVVDMLMPNKEGVETIMEIKARWPSTRVIAVSAGSGVLMPHQLLELARHVGADAVMPKPLRAPAFVALVEEVLARPARPAA